MLTHNCIYTPIPGTGSCTSMPIISPVSSTPSSTNLQRELVGYKALSSCQRLSRVSSVMHVRDKA